MERYAPTKAELLLATEKANDHIKNWGGPSDTFSTYLTAFVAGIEYVKATPSPWKYEVHHVQHQEDADEYATISDGKVTLYIDGGVDDGDEMRVVNLLNELKIKLDYDHGAEFVASEDV